MINVIAATPLCGECPSEVASGPFDSNGCSSGLPNLGWSDRSYNCRISLSFNNTLRHFHANSQSRRFYIMAICLKAKIGRSFDLGEMSHTLLGRSALERGVIRPSLEHSADHLSVTTKPLSTPWGLYNIFVSIHYANWEGILRDLRGSVPVTDGGESQHLASIG